MGDTPHGGLRRQLQEKDQQIAELTRENLALMESLRQARRELLRLESVQPVEAEDGLPASLPPDLESEITVRWGESPLAARLTRTHALSRLREGAPLEAIVHSLRNAGTKVD